jgi:hypothetical protein
MLKKILFKVGHDKIETISKHKMLEILKNPAPNLFLKIGKYEFNSNNLNVDRLIHCHAFYENLWDNDPENYIKKFISK